MATSSSRKGMAAMKAKKEMPPARKKMSSCAAFS
jgi:hypothetical protein